MKKTMYLNYNLDNPEDALCYEFLMSLDRAKKKVVNRLLLNSGMISPEAIQQVRQTEEQKKSNRKSSPATRVVKEKPPVTVTEVKEERIPEPVVEIPAKPMTTVPLPTLTSTSVQQEPMTSNQEDDDMSADEAAMLTQLGAMFQSMQS